MFKTLKAVVIAAAGTLEAVAHGLRSTITPDDGWMDELNDVFYGATDDDYGDCPFC